MCDQQGPKRTVHARPIAYKSAPSFNPVVRYSALSRSLGTPSSLASFLSRAGFVVSVCVTSQRSRARSRLPSAEMAVTRRSAPLTSPLARARQLDAAVSKSLFTQFGAARGLTRRRALVSTRCSSLREES